MPPAQHSAQVKRAFGLDALDLLNIVGGHIANAGIQNGMAIVVMGFDRIDDNVFGHPANEVQVEQRLSDSVVDQEQARSRTACARFEELERVGIKPAGTLGLDDPGQVIDGRGPDEGGTR